MDDTSLRLALHHAMSGVPSFAQDKLTDNLFEVFERFTAAKDAEIRNLKSLNAALESDNANNSMNLEHLSSQLSDKEAHFIEHAKSEAQVIEDLRYCNRVLQAEIDRMREGIARYVADMDAPIENTSTDHRSYKDRLVSLLSPADRDGVDGPKVDENGLLPCPFCDRKVEFYKNEDSEIGGWFHFGIWCHACRLGPSFSGNETPHSNDILRNKWNRRGGKSQ